MKELGELLTKNKEIFENIFMLTFFSDRCFLLFTLLLTKKINIIIDKENKLLCKIYFWSLVIDVL